MSTTKEDEQLELLSDACNKVRKLQKQLKPALSDAGPALRDRETEAKVAAAKALRDLLSACFVGFEAVNESSPETVSAHIVLRGLPS